MKNPVVKEILDTITSHIGMPTDEWRLKTGISRDGELWMDLLIDNHIPVEKLTDISSLLIQRAKVKFGMVTVERATGDNGLVLRIAIVDVG